MTPMVEMIQKLSSHVSAVGYDAESGELHIEYSNGTKAVYHGVPADIAELVTNGYSVGSALHNHVKGKFEVSQEK